VRSTPATFRKFVYNRKWDGHGGIILLLQYSLVMVYFKDTLILNITHYYDLLIR
jgi:hypothetical protein